MRLSRTAEVVNLVENLFSCHRTEQVLWKEEAQEKKQFYRFYSFLRKNVKSIWEAKVQVTGKTGEEQRDRRSSCLEKCQVSLFFENT